MSGDAGMMTEWGTHASVNAPSLDQSDSSHLAPDDPCGASILKYFITPFDLHKVKYIFYHVARQKPVPITVAVDARIVTQHCPAKSSSRSTRRVFKIN